MGILIELYDKLMNGIISKEEEKILHQVGIGHKGKNDSKNGLYQPDSCPCEYGICNECIKGAVSS